MASLDTRYGTPPAPPVEATEKPWLNGKPYYCATCGLGLREYMACEDGDCVLETVEVAVARQQKALTTAEADDAKLSAR